MILIFALFDINITFLLDRNIIFVISNASERVCEYQLPKLKGHLIVILSPVHLINWKFFKQFIIKGLCNFYNLWTFDFHHFVQSLSNGFLILVLSWTTVYYTDVPTLHLAPSFIMSLNLKNFPYVSEIWLHLYFCIGCNIFWLIHYEVNLN